MPNPNNVYGTGGKRFENPHRPAENQGAVQSLPNFDLKTLTKELFDKTADEWAQRISNKNKPTQLRRFYDELIMWNERASVSDQAFQDALPFVYMMKSKVAYAKGRQYVDWIFQDFINKMINQIENRETLNNAKLFMEAVMGFYKQYKKD